MHLKHVRIRNFRLLQDAELDLSDTTTVIVGRNNSGKTSLTEVFRRILAEKTKFELEDFSLGCHAGFWSAYGESKKPTPVEDVRKLVPFIEAEFVATYDKDAEKLGPVSSFIIDLNPACTEVLFRFRYELSPGGLPGFLEKIDPPVGTDERTAFFRALKQRIPQLYIASVCAIDPGDPTNTKQLELKELRSLLRGNFINAQRGLDDNTDRDNAVLGKILELLFKSAKSTNAPTDDQTKAKKLQDAVQSVQTEIEGDFNKQLDELLPAFQLFGYPRLPDPLLKTETVLDVESLLTGHTTIRYTGPTGISLPESHSGLGTRNLIYILLKLLEFFKAHQASDTVGINVVFIEEPEAHLHPQMQEVFITKLGELAKAFPRVLGSGQDWPVQFVVTTHSSHLANKASFRSVRYFLSSVDTNSGTPATKVKDLARGFSGKMKDDEAFIQQYMTLTCCDLLFADKAVLVEGTCERMLLPRLIERLDQKLPPECHLSSQYVSVLEVAGAYAHRFFGLLEFLELRSLIITDIDAIDSNNKNRACLVSEGDKTSNSCLKNWFPDTNLAGLLSKRSEEKEAGLRRVAYQTAEAAGGPVGRSFEEALVLANSDKFGIKDKTGFEQEQAASDAAKANGSKTELALKLAIEDAQWSAPSYIVEGLRWLVADEIAASNAKTTAQANPGGEPRT